MPNVEIDFSKIQTYEGSKQKGFEQLVCQLAERSKPENAKEFIRKDGAGGDAGVECYWKLEDGSEYAWQAKYFLQPLTSTQWKQITKSVESALSKHPALTKYYICLPKDRNDSRRRDGRGKRVTTELDKWYSHVKKWRAIAAKRSMDVKFEYWGKHEITSNLTDGTTSNVGLAEFWFDTTSRKTDIWASQSFPTNIVEQRIRDEIDILRKSRFFEEFDTTGYSSTLARKLTKGELSGGTDGLRCKAVAWCVRFLIDGDLRKAELYYLQAKELGTCDELDIADAFISSRKGEKAAALHTLAGIGSPISRTASLMVVAHHEGPRDAVKWLKKAGVDAASLDSDGKAFLLGCYHKLADWDTAHEFLDALTDDDMRRAPVLHRIVAMTHLLFAVPDEFRSGILYFPPFDVLSFPLASDSLAINARRVARDCFLKAAEVSQQLNCPLVARLNDEYAVWLELVDPDDFTRGRQRLETKLRNAENALSLVRLGFQFEIELDVEAIEREIDRQTALNGGLTYDTAIARLALVFIQQTPKDASNYIERHQDSLSGFINNEYMHFVRIELMVRAGRLDEARNRLETLENEELSEPNKSHLRRIIAEAGGADPIERRKLRFKETNLTVDLSILVDQLEAQHEWVQLCKYGQILFERTKSLSNAERLAVALHNSGKNDRLVEFLDSNETMIMQSKQLRQLRCWSLYHEGALLEARTEMAKLGDDLDDVNFRNLNVNLAISLGDWNAVSAFVGNECKEKDNRNAPELLGTAQLALRLDSVYQAKELLSAAVQKGNEDPKVLAAAYHIATSAGWENQEVSQWIQKAADLSGDDGPIQKFTLREFLDLKPDWERRDSEISRRLMCGDLPMFLAAQLRNMSLGSMMVYAALGNLGESDPRRRDEIPAYSGDQRPTPLETVRHIGIDATALVTFSLLNVLEEALDAFETVHIPHSTLGWLFEEKQRLTFHQPSRINDARRILDWLADGTLEKLSPTSVPDSDLSDQVGEDLAQFIAEAELARNADDSQRVVVKPAPVYRIASLLEEEADLTSHERVLSSCQSIIDKLLKQGQITRNEAERAYAFFGLQEKPWPNQPPIADGAILYLDDLALKYFLHLGILRKLNAAGFRLVISQRVLSETNQYICYERITGEAKNHIERIRAALNARIESGKIIVRRRTNSAREAEDHAIFEHPTAGVLSLASQCDAIIVDDRSLNQHANVIEKEVKTPIVSTLDVINALCAGGVITEREKLEHRTQLRQAGYFFVPVTENELARHLGESTVENGEVIETAELKAIRENILQVRMSTWLQLPKEEYWLKTLLGVCHRVLAGLWRANTDFKQARARSNWITSLIDLRGWAQVFPDEVGESRIWAGSRETILSLLAPPIDQPQEVKDEYRKWVEERFLARIKEQNPELYIDLVEWYRSGIEELVSMHTKESEDK